VSRTWAELVDDVIVLLAGNTRYMDQSTYLTAGIDSDDLDITVADGTQVSKGVVEIDSEMLWVDSTSASNLVVPPYGRGFSGTNAAAHTTGTRVTFNPTFPRAAVKRAINETIGSVSGDLYGIGYDDFTYEAARLTYSLDATATGLLDLTWELPGPSQLWERVRRWSFNRTTLGPTVDVLDPVLPGRTVRYTFMKDPAEFTTDADVFTTATGLPASCVDVITYGAAARLMAGVDAARINPQAVGGNLLDDKSNVGSAAALSRQLYAMHVQRKTEEQKKLLDQFPAFVHYQR
jgi:hypothetical protein